jgi:hypothetical protein
MVANRKLAAGEDREDFPVHDRRASLDRARRL